jgi:hypothetical protein
VTGSKKGLKKESSFCRGFLSSAALAKTPLGQTEQVEKKERKKARRHLKAADVLLCCSVFEQRKTNHRLPACYRAQVGGGR